MIRQEITYHDNYEVKCFKEYVNDVLIEEIHYNDKGLQFNSRTWYKNGQLQSEYKYTDARLAYEYQSFNTGKKFLSYSRTWHENGQLESDTQFVDGIIHGWRRTWYDNGQMAREVPYVDGVVKGTASSWLENGEFSSKLEFDGGIDYD